MDQSKPFHGQVPSLVDQIIELGEVQVLLLTLIVHQAHPFLHLPKTRYATHTRKRVHMHHKTAPIITIALTITITIIIAIMEEHFRVVVGMQRRECLTPGVVFLRHFCEEEKRCAESGEYEGAEAVKADAFGAKTAQNVAYVDCGDDVEKGEGVEDEAQLLVGKEGVEGEEVERLEEETACGKGAFQKSENDEGEGEKHGPWNGGGEIPMPWGSSPFT